MSDTIQLKEKEVLGVIRNAPSLSKTQQMYIVASRNDKLIVQLSKRHDITYEASREICKIFYNYPERLVYLTRNPSVSSLVLANLCKHPSPEIRRALVVNPAVPVSAKREAFYHDVDKVVRTLARQLV